MNASDYNQYPKGFKNYEFKNREVFELLKLEEDEDNPSLVKMPVMVSLPSLTNTVLFEETRKEIVDGEEVEYKEQVPVHLALIRSVGANGEIVLDRGAVYFTRSGRGRLTLNPKVPRDRRIFEYMYYSSYCQNSPYRDPSVTPKYKLVQPEKEAQEKTQKRRLKAKAMTTAAEASDVIIEDLYSILGSKNPKSLSLVAKREELEGLAEESPEKFMTQFNSNKIDYEALARKSTQLKVVKNDQKNGVFYIISNDRKILEYDKGKDAEAPYLQYATALAKDEELTRVIRRMVNEADSE